MVSPDSVKLLITTLNEALLLVVFGVPKYPSGYDGCCPTFNLALAILPAVALTNASLRFLLNPAG